jgi:hypothetical protein
MQKFLASSAPWLLPMPAFAGQVQTGSGVDFVRYRTYEWLGPTVLTGTGIAESHNRQLERRGFAEVAAGADLQIAIRVLTESSLPAFQKFPVKSRN